MALHNVWDAKKMPYTEGSFLESVFVLKLKSVRITAKF
jgi:hypothetical protein